MIVERLGSFSCRPDRLFCELKGTGASGSATGATGVKSAGEFPHYPWHLVHRYLNEKLGARSAFRSLAGISARENAAERTLVGRHGMI